jgi:outer membrane protein OmpA-like peptidoglycan-associated protein
MMIAALLALAAGAIAGIYLASRHFLRKRLPASVAFLHGLGGATGFTLVLLAVVREPSFRPIRDVLYLLIATVVLGVVNLLFHIRKVRHRTSLILLHGLTAVTAAAMLIRAIWIHSMPIEQSVAATVPQPPVASAPAAADAAPQATALDAAAPQAATEDAGKPAPDEFVIDETVRQALDQPIQFGTKSAQPSGASQGVIRDIAKTLKAHPEIGLIEVQGHADERGEDGPNVELTRARAAAVAKALEASGVASERLRSAGYGARCPVDPACRQSGAPDSCHSPESWQRDRRVVFLVLKVGNASFQGEVACAQGADLIPPESRSFHKD